MSKRGKSKTQMGTVVSDKMQKTITVRVDRLIRHPVYGKVLRRSIRFKAHDEKNQARTGDKVTIRETRPLSRDKRWALVSVLGKAGGAPEHQYTSTPAHQRTSSPAHQS